MLRTKTAQVAIVLAGFGLILLLATVIVSKLPSAAPTVQSGTVGKAHLATGSLLNKQVPDLTLVDERGHRTSLASFRGRYLVLAPFMTLCHEVCPMTTAALERVQATLDKDGLAGEVTVAEVSVDPWRDKPARLRAYQRMTGLKFRMLTGSRAQLARLWKFFGVYFKRVPQSKPPDKDWLTGKPERFDVQHSDGLFIIDPRGRWRVASIGMPSVGGRLSPTLKRLLNDQGNKNLHHPQAPWTPKQALADLFTVKQLYDASASKLKAGKPPSAAEVHKALAGSPAPLAALHSQSGALLGGGMSAFKARLAALKGRPVVVNEWASWCPPCRGEFPLFARASANYGKQVAFLGVDVADNSGNAKAFLREHPVSYPSFVDSNGSIAGSFGSAQALPTTIFFTPGGKKAYTHIGYYSAQAALDSDIERYALGR